MGKKIIGVVLLILSIIGIIALAIWCGYPGPAGFERAYIVYVLALLCLAGLISGIAITINNFIDL